MTNKMMICLFECGKCNQQSLPFAPKRTQMHQDRKIRASWAWMYPQLKNKDNIKKTGSPKTACINHVSKNYVCKNRKNRKNQCNQQNNRDFGILPELAIGLEALRTIIVHCSLEVSFTFHFFFHC